MSGFLSVTGNEAEDLDNYAVLDEKGTVVNVAWSGPAFAAASGWVRIGHLIPEPAIGWRTPDGGATWELPETEQSVAGDA